jgi:hypothetical protein
MSDISGIDPALEAFLAFGNFLLRPLSDMPSYVTTRPGGNQLLAV